jgi:ADP-heptose:LPS heptosyltransferase
MPYITLKTSRIALINPTKFMGNLLLAGGLIQRFAGYCRAEGIKLLLVLDDNFRLFPGPLFELDEVTVVYYPRSQLVAKTSRLTATAAWLACVRQIRRFQADLAFTIEEDSVCHRLTHLSGAECKVSCTTQRYHFGFDEVLDIQRLGRAAGETSIWYAYRDVFRALGFPMPDTPGYMDLSGFRGFTPALEMPASRNPIALLHAGASKVYKQWPIENFAALVRLLAARGFYIVLAGAGVRDKLINAAILQAADCTDDQCLDACDKLNWAQLAALMQSASLMVGNDSGPSHLASAMGLPGVVIFGPSDAELWQPLASVTRVISKRNLCQTDCTRHHCLVQRRCLSGISADEVAAALDQLKSASGV